MVYGTNENPAAYSRLEDLIVILDRVVKVIEAIAVIQPR